MAEAPGSLSGLDRLLEVVSRQVRTEQLGSPGSALYLGHLQLVVSIKSFEGEACSITVDGAGMSLDAEQARLRCAYEVIERVVGTAPAAVAAHARGRCDEGVVVPWQEFTPYARAELERLAADSPRRASRWCRARGMLTGHPYFVPASKVFPAWPSYVPPEEFDGECDSSGLAAGIASDPMRCQVHALCEVLERDALMLAWRLPNWPVHPMGDIEEAAPELARFFRDQGLRGTFLEIGDPALAPVALCLLTAPGGGVTCGSACDPDLRTATCKSALEAVMLWTAIRNAGPGEEIPAQDIRTSLEHVQHAWRHPDATLGWFDALPHRGAAVPPATLRELAMRCRDRFFGAEPLFVDLDLGEARTSRSYVCRVLQPHAARKEWRADLPFVGGRRLEALLTDKCEINPLPHPYG